MSSKLKSWLLLAIIFVVGVVTGVALTIGLAPHFGHQPGPQQINRLWMAKLIEQLNLTADQQAKIQPILTDAKTRFQSLHRDEVERGSQIMKEAHDQISALLTSEQQAELQKLEADREKMFLEHMRPWGPPPPGGPGGMHHHDGTNDSGGMPPPPGASTNAPPPGPAPGP
jgi:Spy/CpxP family protein refolding chaperone